MKQCPLLLFCVGVRIAVEAAPRALWLFKHSLRYCQAHHRRLKSPGGGMAWHVLVWKLWNINGCWIFEAHHWFRPSRQDCQLFGSGEDLVLVLTSAMLIMTVRVSREGGGSNWSSKDVDGHSLSRCHSVAVTLAHACMDVQACQACVGSDLGVVTSVTVQV